MFKDMPAPVKVAKIRHAPGGSHVVTSIPRSRSTSRTVLGPDLVCKPPPEYFSRYRSPLRVDERCVDGRLFRKSVAGATTTYAGVSFGNRSARCVEGFRLDPL